MKTFFIADPHFGHKAIISYENRPFETAEEMDKEIINNWNRVVKQKDKIYLLGCVLKQNIAQIQEMLYSKRKL